MPNENELLVRVRAASLNFIDAGLVRRPVVLRLLSGLRKRKFTGFGLDFAGVVEAVGKNVTDSNQATKSLAESSAQSRSTFAFAKNASP